MEASTAWKVGEMLIFGNINRMTNWLKCPLMESPTEWQIGWDVCPHWHSDLRSSYCVTNGKMPIYGEFNWMTNCWNAYLWRVLLNDKLVEMSIDGEPTEWQISDMPIYGEFNRMTNLWNVHW